MRLREKKQLTQVFGLLETCKEALSFIGDRGAVLDSTGKSLLGDMSEGLLYVGSFADERQGPGTKTAALIGELREEIGRIGPNQDIDLTQLEEKIALVVKYAHLELKANKLEVVFLPYNASMWDSFESIYFAAKKDPDCEVRCIPIPWYEKNTDGSLGSFHWEGDRFPATIDITDYRHYNLEEHHPDVIFVQSPYDRENAVSSLHPDFFSDTLKAQTDYLVYIDYGVPIWVPKNPCAHDLFSSTFNFDLFVTYSEEYANDIKCSLQKLTDKKSTEVAALGSAKFDKVLKATREDYPLLDSWRNKVTDGKKKVILFNTSLGTLLKDSEHYLKRLAQILTVFKKNEEIVLWWRPHPLLQGTIESLRPELRQEYQHIVDEYRNDGCGIYDDTDDLHRAIVWSDAYYGDESSLVFLYCATGKPFSLITELLLSSDWFTAGVDDFTRALQWRIHNMRQAKGANIFDANICIWWHNFSSDVQIERFLSRYLHYVIHTENYPDAETYKQLQLQLFYDFVKNPDGTAGEKIYNYCKQKVVSKVQEQV